MRAKRSIFGMIAVVATMLAASPHAQGVRENSPQVRALNTFADNVMAAHRARLKTHDVRETSRVGGYARMPKAFTETTYHDTATGRLLSRIRWLRDTPDTPQMVELFFYDAQGRVAVDYFVSYMMDARNAPFNALINVHFHDDALHAFRQFDIDDDAIFESCQGSHFGETVDVHLDFMDIPPAPELVSKEVYTACFGLLPQSNARYIDARKQMEPSAETDEKAGLTVDTIEGHIAELGIKIAAGPDNAALYVKRGQAFFLMRQMAAAIADFDTALKIDASIDAAYFGRGMALGRVGDLAGAIEALSIYIQRNPNSSKGYTKRGVRHIWNKDLAQAEKDLSRAVELDDRNAEALDDLGVVKAQTGRLNEALAHFTKARAIAPRYQKVHHNLAMVHFLGGDFTQALTSADESLALLPNGRDSLLLKGSILDAMGRASEAAIIREKAEFLPEANWSERTAIH